MKSLRLSRTTFSGLALSIIVFGATLVFPLFASALTPVPASGSVLSGSTETFSWDEVTDATNYAIWVGRSTGTYDIFKNSDLGNARTVSVSSLPADGSVVYVRIWYKVGSYWSYQNFNYKASGGSAGGISGSITTITPVPQSTGEGIGSTETFTWNSVAGALQYYVYLGTSVGAKDLFNQSTGEATSVTITNIPQTGILVTLRLWYKLSTGWKYQDFAYKVKGTSTGEASSITTSITMVTPPSQTYTTAVGPSQVFTWNSVTGASQYWVYLGTSLGTKDIFTQSAGLNQSSTITNIPQNGQILYLRIWYKVGTLWKYNDFTYKAGGTATTGSSNINTVTPQPSSPANVSVISSASQTFTWNSVTGAVQYWVYLGTSLGAKDIFTQSAGPNTSITLTSIPQNGQILYLRIWYKVGTLWKYNDFTYKAGNGGSTSNLPPLVSLSSSLSGGQTIWAPASIPLLATASDPDGYIVSVDFFLDGAKIGSDSSSPYNFTASSVSAGNHSFTAVAKDNLGAQTTSAPLTAGISDNSGIDPILQVVSSLPYTVDVNNLRAPAGILLKVINDYGSDTVGKVIFFSNNIIVGEDSSKPFEKILTGVSAGTYTYSAKAFSPSGVELGTSNIVTITVSDSTLSVSCTGSRDTSTGGLAIRWTATANPTGVYQYFWSGDEGLTGTLQNVLKTYLSTGLKEASVLVDDGLNRYQANCSLTL